MDDFFGAVRCAAFCRGDGADVTSQTCANVRYIVLTGNCEQFFDGILVVVVVAIYSTRYRPIIRVRGGELVTLIVPVVMPRRIANLPRRPPMVVGGDN